MTEATQKAMPVHTNETLVTDMSSHTTRMTAIHGGRER
mgnify:CR=1 FL=1